MVFGHTGGFATPVDLDTIAAGTGGFKIQGENAGDLAGTSVSRAGDVNGDGVDDIIVGIFDYFSGSSSTDNAGAAYVVFGRRGGFGNPVDLEEVAAGTGGFKILGQNPHDIAGGIVSAAGDVNGDGLDDLAVGAGYNSSGGSKAGAAYVIYGSRTPLFTAGNDVHDLNEFALSQVSLSQATHALGGADVVTLSETENLGLLFYGGDGNDRIIGSSHVDRIGGDAGNDSVLGLGGGDTLYAATGMTASTVETAATPPSAMPGTTRSGAAMAAISSTAATVTTSSTAVPATTPPGAISGTTRSRAATAMTGSTATRALPATATTWSMVVTATMSSLAGTATTA